MALNAEMRKYSPNQTVKNIDLIKSCVIQSSMRNVAFHNM